MNDSVDKKGVLKAMFLAILIAFLAIGILAWQYQRIEKERLPALEEKIEKRSTEDVLDKFMQMRIDKNEKGTLRYLTEGAVQQRDQAEFSLLDDFESYEILQSEKLDEEKYRYVVKIYEEGMGDFIEVITLIKILDNYYIDSVQIAG